MAKGGRRHANVHKLGLSGKIAAYWMKHDFARLWMRPKDYVPAYRWYILAAGQGDDLAGKFQTLLEKSMTPNQIAKAQRLAREWKAKASQ